MSSNANKSSSETLAAKQRKSKTSVTPKSSTSSDARAELADLVKRKAEISVSS